MKYTIGIVASLFNQEFVDGMLKAATEALQGHELVIKRVPGAFEIPLAVQRMASSRPHAILALGVIWQGKTAHADLIGREVTSALMRISLENNLPVLHQVIMVHNEKQARERCLGKKLNRGREAAEAALALLQDG